MAEKANRSSSDNNRQVTIEKLVLGGYGLGRLASGQVALVSGVLPGEAVVIRPVLRKKDYQIAVPVTVEKPSPHRVPSPCPYYDQCGGCDLQHIAYHQQIVEKRLMLVDHLRHSGLDATVLERVSEVAPSALEFGYRQRIRLHVDRRSLALGYHRKNSHQVVDIAACLIADPLLNRVLAALRQSAKWIEFIRQLEEISLFKDEATARVIAIFKWRRQLRPTERNNLEALLRETGELGAIMVEDSTGRQTVLSEGAKPLLIGFSLQPDETQATFLHFSVEPGGFTQVNAGVNLALIRTALGWVKRMNSRSVLDLYCGMGNFAIPLSLVSDEVHGVDLQRAAIRAAEHNAAENRRGNCHFHRGSAKEGAARLLSEGKCFDSVVLDPPRQGCKEVIDLLPQFGARNLIYISCDPATLARDLNLLTREKYQIREIRPFDMFPQTHHLETAVLLVREAIEA